MYCLVFNASQDSNGKFMWPGYSENVRVLKWVFERVTGNESNVVRTPIGYMPKSLDISGLGDVPMDKLLNVDRAAWAKEVGNIRKFYDTKFGERLPSGIRAQLDGLERRLQSDD